MSEIDEVKLLEEKMLQAGLGPDPKFFEEVLARSVEKKPISPLSGCAPLKLSKRERCYHLDN